jgi:ribosomal protection tetracycline resistance protein
VGELHRALTSQTARGLVHPVYFGAAATGVGVELLVNGILELLSWRRGDEDARGGALIFKVERGPAGEKIAFVRVFEGCIRVGDRVHSGRCNGARITLIEVFERGRSARQSCVVAGQIGKLWGLAGIGDAVDASGGGRLR